MRFPPNIAPQRAVVTGRKDTAAAFISEGFGADTRTSFSSVRREQCPITPVHVSGSNCQI
jgi:hypothetical protein